MVEKYFPHSTMQEFMSSLHEDTLEGTYTMRLTPKYITEKPTHGRMMQFFEDELCHHNKIKKVLAFREEGEKCGLHYHIRLVTTIKTRKTLQDLIKKNFTIPEGKGRGNQAYAVRSCQNKDKTVWKSATYCAKAGDCVIRKGYSLDDVKFFVEYGRKLANFKGMPKFEQIIVTYGLDKISQMELRGRSIYESVIDYHIKKKIEIPPQHRIHNIIHNICFTLSSNYRLALKERICEGIDQKLLGNFNNF